MYSTLPVLKCHVDARLFVQIRNVVLCLGLMENKQGKLRNCEKVLLTDDTRIKNFVVTKAVGCRFKKLTALSGYVTTSSGTSSVARADSFMRAILFGIW